MTPSQYPQATAPRVMVMEAIERHGGTLRSRHGVQARLIAIHGELCNSRLPLLLRDMEKAGLVALNTTTGPNHSTKITEVMIVETPPNFLAPISKLRSKKNVPWSAGPGQPEKMEDRQGQPEEVTPVSEAATGFLQPDGKVQHLTCAEVEQQGGFGRPVGSNEVVGRLLGEAIQKDNEIIALRSEIEGLRALVVRQAQQLAGL